MAPILPDGMNSKNEDIPGPSVIPKALAPTKIAENLLYAQVSILMAKNFLVINLDPPYPTKILPTIKKTKPAIFPDSLFKVSVK